MTAISVTIELLYSIISLLIKTKHRGVKYDCKQCHYRAIIPGSLKYHIQTVYEGVKYNCNQCDYRTTTKGSLACLIQVVHVGLGALIF